MLTDVQFPGPPCVAATSTIGAGTRAPPFTSGPGGAVKNAFIAIAFVVFRRTSIFAAIVLPTGNMQLLMMVPATGVTTPPSQLSQTRFVPAPLGAGPNGPPINAVIAGVTPVGEAPHRVPSACATMYVS